MFTICILFTTLLQKLRVWEQTQSLRIYRAVTAPPGFEIPGSAIEVSDSTEYIF